MTARPPNAKTIMTAIAVMAASACATAPEITVEEETIVEAADEVEVAVAGASNAANDRPFYRVPLRFNPARCPCPEYEVFVYGEWRRVWIEGPPEALAELAEDRSSGLARTTSVAGALTGQVRPSDRRVNYPIFELE